MKNIRKDSVTARLSEVFTLAMAVALLATVSAQAGFIAPQTFDFGDGSGKYELSDDSGNWRTSGSPSITYSADAMNISPPSDGSGTAFASFDGPKNGADFELTHDWTHAGSEASNDAVGVQAFQSIPGGNESSGGYSLTIEDRGGGSTPSLALYRDGWEQSPVNAALNTGDPFADNNPVRLKLIGDYASDGSSIDLTGEYYVWDTSSWSLDTTVTRSDSTPLTGSEYSIGAYKTSSVDNDQFSVVPEPSTLALLGLAGLLLMRRRRRV